MSKKIAEGTAALVLDVKFGSGAFLPDLEQGRQLAQTMVGSGRAHGVRTTALLTAWNSRWGWPAGNAARGERVGRGAGRRRPGRPGRAHVALAREMLALAGLDGPTPPTCSPAARAMDALAGDGRRPRAATPTRRCPGSRDRAGRRPGRRACCAASTPGPWASPPGASAPAGPARRTPGRPAAGIVCRAKPGDRVVAGEPVLELHLDDPARLAAALASLEGAIEVGDEPAEPRPLVLDRIS